MYYIQEVDKPSFFIRIFNIIKLEGNNIFVPLIEIENSKVQEKLAKKTIKIFENLNSKKVVISKNVKMYKTYVNLLNTGQFDVVNGKWLFSMLIPEVIKYVENKKNLKEEETSVYFLVNDFTETVIENIKAMAKGHKHVSVITKYVEKMKKIENQILQETGVVITVMNNKKKSLAKAQIVINADFTNELLNQYNICENAIIIDLTQSLRNLKKRFNGFVVNNYEIKLKNRSEYRIDDNMFFQRELYESEFYKKQPYEYVRKKIIKDGVQIKKLFTKNQEF
mgnify:FL=1